jgi:hypothetical protein
MQTKPFSRKYYKVFIIAILLVLIGVSCLPNAAPAATPIQTVIVLQQIVTRVVTQIVYVPVTVTPTPTPYITDTPGPTDTNTPAAVTASAGRHGHAPAADRNRAGAHPMPVRPRSRCMSANTTSWRTARRWRSDATMDTSWLLVQGSDHANPCWVKAALVKVNTGSFTDPPVVAPVLTPYTIAISPAASRQHRPCG